MLSFGFKYGLPLDADLVVDARFLPNPHWIPELRPHTGRDPDVRDYVLGREAAGEFLDRYTEVLKLLHSRLPARGKALRDAGRGLHRRQAPQRRDRRGAGRGGCGEMGIAAEARHRDLGRGSSRLLRCPASRGWWPPWAAATGSPRRWSAWQRMHAAS